MFDVSIRGNTSDLPALLPDDKQAAYFNNLREQQKLASTMLDALLSKLSPDVIIGIYPWGISDEYLIHRRSFSTLVKDGQAVIQTWTKACSAKFGKSLVIDQ